MSEITISYKDFPNICRICLIDADDEQGFTDLKMIDLYKSLTNIQVKENDKFPEKFCSVCKGNLQEISSFIEKCKNSEACLKKIYLEDYLNNFIKQNEETLYNICNKKVQNDNKNTKVKVGKDQAQINLVNNRNNESEIKVEECNISKTEIKIEKNILTSTIAEVNKEEPVLEPVAVQNKTKLKPTRFFCGICSKGFSKNYLLTQHFNIHTGKTPYKCIHCEQSFTNRYGRNAHIYRTHTENLENIPIHERRFREKRVRLKLTCETCGKVFASRSGLANHHLLHKGIKNFLCNVCGRRFLQRTGLETHITTHIEERRFECKECGKRFKSERLLQTHMRNKLKSPSNCPQCGKKFYWKKALQDHLLTHKDQLDCPYCNKHFNVKTEFSDHVLQHTNKFACNICGKLFTSNCYLKHHMIVHTNDKPYPCSVCGNRYKSKQSLRVHRRCHTGEKPYECTVCLKRFHDSSNFRAHCRYHERVKNGSAKKIKKKEIEK